MRLSFVGTGYRKSFGGQRFAWGLGLVLLGLIGSRVATGQVPGQPPKELRIAAAADLLPVMPVLADLYLKKTGIKLVVNFGSSGVLAAQIENGAPVDLFLGADFIYPERIVAAGLADTKAPIAYARGRLAVWARKDSPLQPISVDKLTDPRIQKIAIADPSHAPFGRAAAAALDRLKLTAVLKEKLVVAENVAQAGQLVESGNADVGLISLTLASSQRYRDLGGFTIVPDSQYPEVRQTAVVLRKSDRKAEAHAFLDWLLSSEIQGQLPNVGMEAVR